MNQKEFALNPTWYGIPDQQQLKDLRIWSDHYHGFARGLKQHEEMMFYVERMGIEKVISLDIGSIEDDALVPSPIDNEEREILEKNKNKILGIIRIDPGFPDESCAKMEKWIRHGPCIGIKYLLPKFGITCSHPNNDQIIRLVAQLGAVVYIHSWLKVGGSPRSPGGGNTPGS